jgi:hypothetical protein
MPWFIAVALTGDATWWALSSAVLTAAGVLLADAFFLQWQSGQAAEWLQQLLAAVQEFEDSLAEAAAQAADSCWGGVCPGVQLLQREGEQGIAQLRDFVGAALEEVEVAAAGCSATAAAAAADECRGDGQAQWL